MTSDFVFFFPPSRLHKDSKVIKHRAPRKAGKKSTLDCENVVFFASADSLSHSLERGSYGSRNSETQ